MATRINGVDSSVLWTGSVGASRLHGPDGTPAVAEDEPPLPAAAPGSSTALHDLFRSLPTAADPAAAPQAANASPAADDRPRNDWLRYVNLPSIKLDIAGDD